MGLILAFSKMDILSKDIGERDLNPGMKYFLMASLKIPFYGILIFEHSCAVSGRVGCGANLTFACLSTKMIKEPRTYYNQSIPKL